MISFSQRPLLVAALAAMCPLWAAEYFASAAGRQQASGTIDDPWELAAALAHPPQVKPGDTIWIRGGTYKNRSLISRLSGTRQAPIIVRSYRGERVILDQDGLDPQNRAALTSLGVHTWFWGLEVTNSDPSRVFPESLTDCPNRQHCRPPGINVLGAGTRIINCVVHDVGDGIGVWSAAPESEIYGNILFFNGWEGQTGGAGHAVYAQNSTGTARITDNVMFASFHSGLHVYGSAQAFLRNFEIEGNTIFNAGLLGDDPNGFGILVGGNAKAENITIARNYLYNPEWYRRSNNLNPSYGTGSTGLILEENYSIGFKALGSDVTPSGFRSGRNVFAGFIDAPTRGLANQQDGNQVATFASLKESGVNKVFLRRNRYEPNLATVTVFNWKGGNEASLDLSGFLKNGDNYEVIDIQNWFAGPVVRGTYSGGAVTVPMQSGSTKPTGAVPGTRYRTSSEFGVFQVRIRKDAPPPPRKIRASRETLRFSLSGAEAGPAGSRTVTISAEPGIPGPMTWRIVFTPPWLRPSHEEGPVPGRAGFTADGSALSPGTYESEIVVATEGGEDLLIPVRLTVYSGVSSPVIDSVSHLGRPEAVLSPDAGFAVLGANLAASRVLAPEGSPTLPPALGGTALLFNGEPAGLVEVSPTRIVALPPAGAGARDGSVEITISTQQGSSTATAEYAPVAIGLLELDELPGHVKAKHSDGSPVAGEGSIPDARAAKAGEAITVTLAGLPASARTSSPGTGAGLRLTVGDRDAAIGGVNAISHGLVEVAFTVPEVPEGPQALTVEFRGTQTQSAAYITVGARGEGQNFD